MFRFLSICRCCLADGMLRRSLSGVLRRSLTIALIVGTILSLINQGDALLTGHSLNIAKLILTYFVPYCVATYGALSFQLNQQRANSMTRAAGKGGTAMPRIDPVPREALGDLEPILETAETRMGFVPNSQLILAHRPEIVRAFAQLGAAINGPSSTISPQLRNLVSQMASRAAGCGYCMAHTTHTAMRVGISADKEQALWSYETSPLFSGAERAALRVAQGAAQVPNAVTDEDFAELKKHYSAAEIVDIVAVISLFGFLNRFNDTMATELESSPIEAGRRFLADKGWSVGKHG